MIPERRMAEEDTVVPSCLDVYSESPSNQYPQLLHCARRDTSSETSGATCFKIPPQKCQCFTYFLAVLGLICSVAFFSIAVKVAQENRESQPFAAPLDSSVTVPTAAPVVSSIPYNTTTTAPVVSPIPYNATKIREPIIFLNCGGPSFNAKNRTWESDSLYPHFFFNKSQTDGRETDALCQDYIFSANNTNEDLEMKREGDFGALFCSERWFPMEGGYEIPVSIVGEYRVELYFMENYHNSSQQRVFNISLEGELVRENFDISLRAGGARLPTKVVKTVFVDDLSVSIYMIASIDNPNINAIAVYEILDE
jgi:hypothetical protein